MYQYVLYFAILIFYNEFLIYYIVLAPCKWPQIQNRNEFSSDQSIKAILLADVHLLGPYKGHWFDKLKREWQMHRAFQSAMTIFGPEVIFILGDLFDEGQWVNDQQFKDYIIRFNKLFYTPPETKIYGVAGNHDVGFHYKMHPILLDRFNTIYKSNNASGCSLITIRNVNFVLINSMSMEQDGCYFCEEAKENLKQISDKLKCVKNLDSCPDGYRQPILLQHFPTYRESDQYCMEHDDSEIEMYRENWDVLSKQSTNLLKNLLHPRVVFSGHSHNYCKFKSRLLHVDEYTISSFSWRNKNDPRFILAEFTPNDYAVTICQMPQESTVHLIYFIGILFIIFSIIFRNFKQRLISRLFTFTRISSLVKN